MKKGLDTYPMVLLFGLLFLFFFQQLTTLVEAVYRYNLIDKEFGFATFGLLAFSAPLYLFYSKKGVRTGGYLFLWLFLLLRCLTPLLPNPLLIVIAGISVALFLNALVFVLSGKLGGHPGQLATGIVIAVLLSICLRAFGSTLDVSMTGSTVISGYLLIVPAGLFLWHLQTGNNSEEHLIDSKNGIPDAGRYFYMGGIFSVIGFIYVFLASPGVVARWTGADYRIINIVLSVCLTLIIFALNSPVVSGKIKKWHLTLWNLLFSLLLMLSIGLQLPDTLSSPAAEPIIVRPSPLLHDLLTYGMLLLAPVLMLNLSAFLLQIRGASPRALAGPALLSSLILLMMILLLIFSNIWGYLGSFGQLFRQRFYLPVLMLILGAVIPFTQLKKRFVPDAVIPADRLSLMLTGVLLCCIIIVGIFWTEAAPSRVYTDKTSIRCMTFNLQQGTDHLGNRSYLRQLAVIRRMNPDILCLQESDVARISAGNNDIVRYLSDQLDYYSYYGPKTITGTFGTAILSRFPLSDCRSIFTYSDQDEVGTAVGKVLINGESILLINSHPAGSDRAMQSHLNMLIKLVQENDRIIAMGDFNFEPGSSCYNQITATLIDSWVYDNPEDTSKRIDYIFLSKNFKTVGKNIVLSPESASDHPAYSADIAQ